MTLANKLALLANTKEELRLVFNLNKNIPFTDYTNYIDFAWTPLALFSGGKTGVWYDPSDLATLYQDAAGTIPVMSDGDPVGKILDKSGNGNHITQTVSAARPIYKTDGILHWIQFDGVDDCFDTPNPVNWNGANFYQSSAITITNSQAYGGVFRFLRVGGNPVSSIDNYFEEYTQATNNYRRALVQRYPSLLIYYDNSNGRPAAGISHVSWSSNDSISAKTQVLVKQPEPVDLGVKSLSSGQATLSLFKGYQGNIMAGRMYGFIWVSDNVKDTYKAEANKYLANKSGVVL